MTTFNPASFTLDNRPNLLGSFSGISAVGEDEGSQWVRIFGANTKWSKVPRAESVYYAHAKELPIVLTCIRLSGGRLDVAYYPYSFQEFKKLWEEEGGREELYSNAAYMQVEEEGYPFLEILRWLKERGAVV